MPKDESKQRDRSPNFPFVDLGAALGRAKAFYDAEKRGSAALAVAAKHWAYSPKSSGLLQTVGALKSYGLMEDEGRGLERRIKLTELALRILLDNRPNSEDKDIALRAAAQYPVVVQKIMEKFPDDVPSPDNLEHFLIFDLRFSPEAAKDGVKIFLNNSELAALYDHGTISVRHDTKVEPVNAPGPTSTFRVSASSGKVESILGPDGSITLQFSGEPTWESYDFLENYIKLRKSVLKTGAKNETKEKKA